VSTALELLQAGDVATFNARRGQRTTIDLFAADLSGLDLTGVDLSNANLEKADLSGTNLTSARLGHADLSGADLTDACLEDVLAFKTKFREAYLGGARAADAQFNGSDFAEADLTGFHAERANFTAARFRDAVLVGAHLNEATFAEARMPGANLRDADLEAADLTRVEAPRIDAAGARMRGVRAEAAQFAGASFKGADLTGADLTGADLTGADLTDARLEGATLARADMFEANVPTETVNGAGSASALALASELHPDDADVSVSGGWVAALWDNAEDDDAVRVRVAWTRQGDPVRSAALDVPTEQVLAKCIVPTTDGRFHVVLFLERTGGVDVVVLLLDPATGCGAPSTARLGYQPAVTPVVVASGNGFDIHGMGRTGTLEFHRWEDGALIERLRAPAGTHRGYCGRLDPILISKGGTLVPVRDAVFGRAQTAPSTFPGDRHAATMGRTGVATAWTVKGERGVRVQLPGADAERVDEKATIGSVDLAAVGERWLLTWTRLGRTPSAPSTPWAAWLPHGEPFPLLDASEDPDCDEVRGVRGGAGDVVAALDVSGALTVLRVLEDEQVEHLGTIA
jgi:uncharacterized protein YjbI with pentapeptide repeats